MIVTSTAVLEHPALMGLGHPAREWDEVMAVVKRAVDVVAQVSPRAGLVLKADIRPGWTGQMTAKVERLERGLEN